jgi:hypothetical protein
VSFSVVAGTNGQYSAGASGTTYAIGAPSSTIPVGSLVVGTWTCDAASNSASAISDNSTQPGAANVYTQVTPTASGTSLTTGLFFCLKTTRAILATDTINITISLSASRRAAWVNAFTPSNGNANFNNNWMALTQSATVSPVTTGSFTSGADATDGLGIIALGVLVPGATSTWGITAPTGFTPTSILVDPATTPHAGSALAWKANAAASSFTSSGTVSSITRAHQYAAIFTDNPIPRKRITRVRRVWTGR